MRATTVRALFALLLTVNACDDSGNSNPVTVPVTAVRLTPQSVQLNSIGETRQLVATVDPANATDKAIIWESSDSSVVTVSTTGVVTAMAAGAGVFITAITHDGHHQASSNVSVVP